MKTDREIQARELRARHLFKALCAHNAVEKFVRNVANLRYSCPKKIYAVGVLGGNNSLLTLLKECVNIDRSFTWGETPEGHEFWSNLHYKQTDDFCKVWEDYLRITK